MALVGGVNQPVDYEAVSVSNSGQLSLPEGDLLTVEMVGLRMEFLLSAISTLCRTLLGQNNGVDK
jgi:hypothetical protein